MFITEDMTEWSASQANESMADGEDDLNLAAAIRAEQQGGNPLFKAEFQAIGGPRRWHGGRRMQKRFG